ncbi:sensor histidine kinase [Umezawaea tangerina]|uniref:Signal transduction histidine kinase n=1 Tax=Umezawaea tangerina TaxID=84725 RepID=A0A2T0STQ4_9PSEU|nr:histidine kinase [Umezawaea tangerina]PRY36780.1 signal transduction histidine kinase [Umezawaea tangerina]
MALPANRVVAAAALGRAVLLGRAALTLTAAGVGLRVLPDPRTALAVAVVVVVSTATGLVVLARRPEVVRRPVPVVLADSVVVLGVLVAARGGVAFFCFAAGACALGGVVLGMRGLALWVPHAALGYSVAAHLLRTGTPSPHVAVFPLAFPPMDVLAGVAAAVATGALVRYVDLSVDVVASAQRSAAASERARLARELHDSVGKTLRGVSFAALALPSSLRRHPELAEQLAGTVSQGAMAAAREARELLTGLRLDAPDQDFAATLRRICLHCAELSGVAVTLTAAPVDPPADVRYELSRILDEALRNAVRHGHPRRIAVTLAQTDRLRLRVHDDGDGFRVPGDLSALTAGDHFGVVGMAERARYAGGVLDVTSTPGRGTTVEVSVPVVRPVRMAS